MIINPNITASSGPARVVEKESHSSKFGKLFMEVFNNANQQQLCADKAVAALLNGEVEEIHQVMIATEQARLSLQLAVQVTNKTIEAYKDISRMQI